jgi:hypothetical protein
MYIKDKHMLVFKFTRVIQKISSVCEYCLCSAAVTVVLMRAEFVDAVARHGRNMQTCEQCLRIVLCDYNV